MFHDSLQLDLGHKGEGWGVLVWVGTPHTEIVWAGQWCHPLGPFTNKKCSHLYTEIMRQRSSLKKKKGGRERR